MKEKKKNVFPQNIPQMDTRIYEFMYEFLFYYFLHVFHPNLEVTKNNNNIGALRSAETSSSANYGAVRVLAN